MEQFVCVSDQSLHIHKSEGARTLITLTKAKFKVSQLFD